MFAGIETGTISYYKLSDDLNVLESIQTFNAHSSAAVVQCYFCPLRNWILSIGAEGSFVWSELNGNKLGNYILPSKPRCFQVSLPVMLRDFMTLNFFSLTLSLDLYFMEMILGVLLSFDFAPNPKLIQLLRWKVIKDQSAACIGTAQHKSSTPLQQKKIESFRGILGANRVILSN